MLSSAVSSALALLILGASRVDAHFNWVDGLSDCWQECLGDTSNGCDSSKCICDASQSNSYLPAAVECAVKKCEADELSLELGLLFPLQGWCFAAGNSIPDDVMSSAYACAAATATAEPAPTTTPNVEHSDKPNDHTTKKGGAELTEVITSTMTKTTTNEDGQTLQIIVPVVMGPNTMSFGETTTSTLDGEATSTESPSSAPASPSQTAEAPASTQAEQQPQAGSSTTSSQPAQRTSNSNGSPFENMQAAAGRWSVSGVLAGMGVAVGIFIRL